MSIAERVTAEIERTQHELLEWLSRLVGFRSLSGQEGPAQEWVAGAVRDLGTKVDVWDVDPEALRGHPGYGVTALDYRGHPNVVGRLAGTGGGRSLIFNGHVDVVPIEDPKLWTHDPWSGDIVDGRMYGRGTSDMKAGLAAMVWAVRVLQATTRLRGDVVLQSVVDEEGSGNGTLSAVLRGYVADGAVVGEPTSMDFVPGHQGCVWFRITVPGISAHGGYRTRGVNAIEKAYVLYWALRDLETERNRGLRSDPLFQHVDVPAPISVGIIRAGNWPGTVPDAAVMEGRVGVRLGEAVVDVRAAVKARIEQASNSDPFLKEHSPSVEYVGVNVPSAKTELDHPLALAARETLQTFRPDYRIWVKTPGTDMRHLMLYGNTPTVIVGPGDDHLAHTANESVAVANVVAAAKFYALLALEWCG